MQVIIDHPELGPQKTYTSAQVLAAALLSYVDNNDDFASGDLVLFGKYAQEKTEIVTLSSVTSTNQLDHTTGPVFDHPAKEPISQVLYDQAEVYRATTEGGSYSIVTTVDLNVDEENTIYNDTAGTTASWYKIRYKNSLTDAYSDYSDEVQGVGYLDDSLRSMTDDVLIDFGDPNGEEVTRAQVKSWLNAGVRRLTLQMIRLIPDYGGAYTTQVLTSGTYAYPTQFIAFKRIQIGSTLADSFKVTFDKESNLNPTYTYYDTAPYVVLRDTTWMVYPNCTGKTAYIYFWQYPATMTSDSDIHNLPYGARDVLVAYAMYKCWLNKDTEKAKAFKYAYEDQVKEFLEFISQARQLSNNNFQSISFGNEDYE